MSDIVSPGADIRTDRGLTVAVAAAIIGIHPSTIRQLAAKGSLVAWKVGKEAEGRPPRGIRISEASCYAYRTRNLVSPSPDAPEPRRQPPRRNAAAIEEMQADLRALGIRF